MNMVLNNSILVMQSQLTALKNSIEERFTFIEDQTTEARNNSLSQVPELTNNITNPFCQSLVIELLKNNITELKKQVADKNYVMEYLTKSMLNNTQSIRTSDQCNRINSINKQGLLKSKKVLLKNFPDANSEEKKYKKWTNLSRIIYIMLYSITIYEGTNDLNLKIKIIDTLPARKIAFSSIVLRKDWQNINELRIDFNAKL